MSTLMEAPRKDRVRVRVSDLVGQHSLELTDVDPATPVADILGESRVQLSLLPSVEWQLRDENTARLLRRDQTVGDFATDGELAVRVQPDARLG